MKTFGFMKSPKGDKPKLFYRSGLTVADFERTMKGAGWLTITQISGVLSGKVPPEAKIRYAILQDSSNVEMPLDKKMAIGMRRIVQLRMPQLIATGKVQKDGKGPREIVRYRWIADENNQAGKNKARRRHTVKGVTRR